MTTIATARLLDGGADLREHLAHHGGLPARLDLDEVARSGLTGRGGAAFPAARKLAAMRPGGTVIGNGSEGEPRSGKDAALLERAPHLVIDGLLLAARAVAADRSVLAVQARVLPSVRRALAERDDAAGVELREVAPGFLSGEATALVAGVAGRRPVPSDRIVHLTESGLRRRPTLVQNVETLAHLARIARSGADAFRAEGLPDDPGTRLLTVSGDVRGTEVVEVPGGVLLGDALLDADADPSAVRAVLVGGYHGAWVGPEALDARLTATAGPGRIRAGAGVLVVVGRKRCGLEVSARIARYLADRTSGRCGPCVNGLPALATAFEHVVRGDPRAAQEVRRLAGVVDGAGACHHPDGTARMAASALVAFADDVAAHAHGDCLAVRP